VERVISVGPSPNPRGGVAADWLAGEALSATTSISDSKHVQAERPGRDSPGSVQQAFACSCRIGSRSMLRVVSQSSKRVGGMQFWVVRFYALLDR